jgi:hypothetical protein
MKYVLPALALAAAGAAALLVVPGLRAEETARDQVERLMPQLLCDDDASRTDAERQLFALGEPARAELERITRDADPRRAVTALRLLQSPKWNGAAKLRDGEKRAQREGDARRPGWELGLAPDEVQERMRRQIDEMRRRFEEMERGFSFEMPELRMHGGKESQGRSSGQVVENDRRLSWSIEEDGSVKVTTKDGRDAAEQTYEAKSLDELREKHPDVAKRLDEVAPQTGGHRFVLRFGPWVPGARQPDPFAEDPADSPPAPALGIEWSPVPEVLREQFDVEAGIVVERVVPGTLADKLGLRRNDVLLQVAGRDVRDASDVRSALDAVKPGEQVSALVLRKAARTNLSAAK